MTLKTIKEYYPCDSTYVGFFDSDYAFKFLNLKDIENIDDWNDTPFYDNENCKSFLEYCGDNNYKSWFFGFFKVQGYFTDGDYDNFYPMIYSDDFGWEKIDIDIEDDQHILIAPPCEEDSETYISKIIMAFKELHPDCGQIITNSEELRNFIKEKKI